MTELKVEAKDKIIVIVRESWKESVISDGTSFVLALALTGFGTLIDNEAMEWIGALLFFLCLCGDFNKYVKNKIMNFQQARDYLSKLEHEEKRK